MSQFEPAQLSDTGHLKQITLNQCSLFLTKFWSQLLIEASISCCSRLIVLVGYHHLSTGKKQRMWQSFYDLLCSCISFVAICFTIQSTVLCSNSTMQSSISLSMLYLSPGNNLIAINRSIVNFHLLFVLLMKGATQIRSLIIYVSTLVTSSLSSKSFFILLATSLFGLTCVLLMLLLLLLMSSSSLLLFLSCWSVVIIISILFSLLIAVIAFSMLCTLMLLCLKTTNQNRSSEYLVHRFPRHSHYLRGSLRHLYYHHYHNHHRFHFKYFQYRLPTILRLLTHHTLCLLLLTNCLLTESTQLLSSQSSHLNNSTILLSSASHLKEVRSLPIPEPLPLHFTPTITTTTTNSSQICPLLLASGSENQSGHASDSSNSSYGHRNPCNCYGTDSNGIFVDCTYSDINQINATLNSLKPHRNSVRSLSIYRLNNSNSESLPDFLFEPFTSMAELHISSTNLSKIGTELTFAGLEDALRTLSFVNSQISLIPKSTLSKLKQLSILDLQSNKIANLDSYAFYGLPLRTLNLQNNLITSLHEFAFGGLENTLDELSLIGNKLENFPLFALRRLRKLQVLKLQSNLISQIPDDGFTRFTTMETLDLQSNRISHLNSRSFITMPKLKTLYCSNNQLTVVSDSSIFAQLHYLETLDLSLNRLRVVNLDGLESIRTLDLSYNHLHDLRLQGMPGLLELFASHNNILQLMNETFLNTTRLEAIYLQHNSIQSITHNAFHRLAELRVLDLSFNQIRQLPSAVFKYTSHLESLYLDNNILDDSGLESGIFQELVELRDLRLQKNFFKKINKGVFYSLPNLQELDLQMNQIEVIESLESLANLQHINLQGNRLSSFNGNVLSSFPSSLHYLQLSNNRLEVIHNDTFRGQTDLEVIWLSYNRLEHISALIFDDLINAEKLYLDHNKITSIENNAFTALKKLVYLNLEYNQLNHLNSDVFAGLIDLRELRLSSSEIIGIEPNVMNNLGSLQILDLSTNQIYTIRRSMFDGANQIEELYLSNVMADEVEADSIEKMKLLQVLDISRNSINARRINSIRLPVSIRHLNISHNNLSNEKGVELSSEFIQQLNQSLQILDLSNTHFRVQNSGLFFSSLNNLKELYLDKNEIQLINSHSFSTKLVTIEKISLNHNLFEIVPDQLIIAEFAPKLKQLLLANNQIKHIQMSAFKNLSSLETLNLSYNRISVIESFAFTGLSKLVKLDLTGNVIRSLLPNVFDNLQNIVYISLANNWLQFVPANFLKVTSSAALFAESLQIFNVDNNPMTRFREDLNSEGIFANLNSLNAHHGNITVIASHDFVGFGHLAQLRLQHNQIQTISPSAFKPLDSLVELDLSHNKLDNLPGERLKGLYQLALLNLSHNSLTELPHFSADLSNILTIDISFNKITRIESFGHLSASVSEISLRHNMISWIANNAFQNMSSLTKIDLRQNFLTQISETIFESIEVRLQTIMLAGNPFQCDCRLLSIYEWLEEHSRLVRLDEEEEMVCDQPEKLKHHSIQSLEPIDFCPIPMITQFDVLRVEPSFVRLGWDVQNETLVGGFTLEYYLTSERSLTSPAGLQLNPVARTAEIRDLVAEKWYTVCVEANGKYLHNSAMAASASSLDIFNNNNKPTAFTLDYHPQRHLLQDFVTSNRKCSQIRTLSSMENRKLIAIPAASIIVAIGLFFVLVLSVCVLAFILFRFRKKRRIQRQRSQTVVSFGSIKPAVEEIEIDNSEDYITYRHFSLPSNENVYS